MSRCECCDAVLNDSEATARFVDENGPTNRYVGMCKKCRDFLPSEVQYVVRKDLKDEYEDLEQQADDFLNQFKEDWDD